MEKLSSQIAPSETPIQAENVVQQPTLKEAEQGKELLKEVDKKFGHLREVV